ncbi:MAG TPA: hypothetical protein DEQ09_10125, partial [Bacteroidales bacterium]|nr:hypothetical protein [Bacteroidales bacterium]
DFKVRFGQGLTAWNGFSRSPLPTAKILMKGNSGIIPCSSSDENDFFRGIAVSLRTRNINILSFASINMIDASTGYDESSDNQYIKSFYTSGIHNTPTTMAKRNRLAENSLGLNINSMNNNFYYGFNIVYSRFSLPVIPGEDTRDIYDFTGDINASFSVDYTWLFKSSYLFGEFAVSHNLKTAFLQGISLNPEGRLRCNILYARTGRGYNSFHGDASGLSTFNKPATSLQANITAELFSSLDFTAGFLRRKELWHNNTSGSFPSSINYLTSVRFSPSEFITVRTDAKHHVSELWVNALQGVKTGNLLRKTNLRLTIETQASESLNLRTRIEKVVITNSSESGFLCYQSAGFIFKNIPLELRARVAIFKTDSYDTRIYAWEDDLLYNPVIRPLYDEGNKSYLMIIYRASGNITLRAKYASTSINAGKDISNMVNEYKFQAVISF